MNGEQTTTGRCMCGDVRYAFPGPMTDVVHCHCESCRRHSSAPFVTFFNVPRERFRYVSGAPVRYRSSSGVERTHCGRCGSPLTYENAHELSVYACTLDDSTLVKPEAHIMVGEMMPWLVFGDSLPCYAKSRSGTEPMGFGPAHVKRPDLNEVRDIVSQTNAARDEFEMRQNVKDVAGSSAPG